MPQPFDKPSLSFDDQIELLIKRGLVIKDREYAKHHLSHLNYYRIAAYCLPFQKQNEDHAFRDGINFETIIDHYCFDSKLRFLLIDAIEKIEVSIRTQWAYHFSQQYGPSCYTIENSSIVKNVGHLRAALEELQTSIDRSDERFIEHHRSVYSDPYPPVWVACEVMSLGQISRFYSNMRTFNVRKRIADSYGFDEKFLEGFLEHLTYVRNVAAHHSRLWNRHLTKKMPLVKNKPAGLRQNLNIEDYAHHRIYNTFVMVSYLIGIIRPNRNWGEELKSLVNEYRINTRAMGFPENWVELPIWRTKTP